MKKRKALLIGLGLFLGMLFSGLFILKIMGSSKTLFAVIVALAIIATTWFLFFAFLKLEQKWVKWVLPVLSYIGIFLVIVGKVFFFWATVYFDAQANAQIPLAPADSVGAVIEIEKEEDLDIPVVVHQDVPEVSPDLQEAVNSLMWPGLLAVPPTNPDLRFDDPEFMRDRVWVSENNEACSGWVSSYTVLAGDPDLYLRDCTEWQIPPGAVFELEFMPEIGAYWHMDLDRIVSHDPVLAARMEGQPERPPLPYLAITPVSGIGIDVVYGDGTVCTDVGTAVIMTGVSMKVSFENQSSIYAKIGIGPGGDPDFDGTLVEWTNGNDVPLPSCHPKDWQPGS